ncbi:hypothetical protein L204_103210 [Cryptococcus depauperatus]|nr:hypothetical protein L204_00042 [Cryptococcus depauperatus CBS 7855]
MPDSEDSSPTTGFAFAPPTLPPGNSTFVPSSTYKPEPMKPMSLAGGLSSPAGAFTPAANHTAPSQPYFPDTYASEFGPTSSSFSSTSGSTASGSFSSIDTLPGNSLPSISKEFARPNASDARRPATAGGALQSRGNFGYLMSGNSSQERTISGDEKVADGARENGYANPFENSPDVKTDRPQHSSSAISPADRSIQQAMPSHRRASEPQFNIPGSSWTSFPPSSSHHAASSTASLALPSAPAHLSQIGVFQQQQQATQYGLPYARSTFNGRPQTSDGLPSYNHVHDSVTLPSAQSIARQIPGIANTSSFFHHSPISRSFADDRSMSMPPPPNTFLGNRSFSFESARNPMASGSGVPSSLHTAYIQPPLMAARSAGSMPPSEQMGYMTLVNQPQSSHSGPVQKKRPRRRYEEIERLYPCGWNGCEKAYGTLNHLNAHVMMQKHGEKRLPSEFKEMRKAWRKRKREAAAAHANAQYMVSAAAWQANQQRLSIVSSSSSSESEWERRESNASVLSAGADPRGSVSYSSGGYPWGQPTQPPVLSVDSRPTTAGSSVSSLSVDGRYIPTPPASASLPSTSYTFASPSAPPTSGAGSVATRRPSAPQHLPLPSHNPMEGFRQAEGDYPTPTANNPFPAGSSHAQNKAALGFSTLTSPIDQSGSAEENSHDFGGQFAFQR